MGEATANTIYPGVCRHEWKSEGGSERHRAHPRAIQLPHVPTFRPSSTYKLTPAPQHVPIRAIHSTHYSVF